MESELFKLSNNAYKFHTEPTQSHDGSLSNMMMTNSETKLETINHLDNNLYYDSIQINKNGNSIYNKPNLSNKNISCPSTITNNYVENIALFEESLKSFNKPKRLCSDCESLFYTPKLCSVSSQPDLMGNSLCTNRAIEECVVKNKKFSTVFIRYETEINNLRNQLRMKQDELDDKVVKIEELQREINKLTSVLDQTQSLDSTCLMETNIDASSTTINQTMRLKKQGVSGESSNKDQLKLKLTKYQKDNSIKELLRDSILKNLLLSNLPSYQVDEMIEYMYELKIERGKYLIIEDEIGDHLYVAQSGQFEVWKGDHLLSRLNRNICIGELALLYNCRRTASVKVTSDAKLWVLDREVYQTIMMRTGMQRQQELLHFLKSVPLLKGLPESKLNKLVELLESQHYEESECIIRQEEPADGFFFVQNGSVKVTQKFNDGEQVIRTLSKGQYFGEKALLSAGARTASVYANSGGADVLCLYRKPFLELIGDLNELKNKIYEDDDRLSSKTSSKSSIYSDPEMEKLENVELRDLQLVCTLGVGGFGRVELVRLSNDNQSTYALKCMKKHHIVQTKQQDHVLSEKAILSECKSSFICRLYKTYKDSKFVYMLMEVCLGGELWTCLRDKIHFDDNETRFSLGCVLEAFDYLHSRGIIYRDLKPENLLITINGYLKLCDFGFSKKIGIGSRTWTFCGTPEYVSPEIILNKGHDSTSDYWSVGILTYELLTGTPPFTGNDPMKIYTLILKGIDATDIFHNRKITFRAASFIQALCKYNCAERLGNGAGGLEEIRSHRYFQGFDWQNLRIQTLKSPFHPKVTGPTDHSNFDDFQEEEDVPPDELSGWDIDF